MSPPLTYEKANNAFSKRNCQLLVTKHEFERDEMDSYSHVTYIATCGHENIITYNQFTVKKRGDFCLPCSRKKQSETRLLLHEDDAMVTNKIEYLGLLLCEKYLQNDFTVRDTNEGCLSDFILKPKSCDLDLWLPIQLKTTLEFDELYKRVKFKIRGDYTNMVLICNCIENERFWIWRGDEIPQVKTLSIGVKSKYAKFEFKNYDITKKLLELYNDTIVNKLAIDLLMIPVSKSIQKEQNNRKKLITRIQNNVNISFSKLKCVEWDFEINGKKIQEKSLSKSNCGQTHKTLKYIPYEKGDNDFYLFHLKNSYKIYLITENIMIQHGIITTSKSVGKKTIGFYPDKYHKFNQYLYDLDDPDDIQKIIEIFS